MGMEGETRLSARKRPGPLLPYVLLLVDTPPAAGAEVRIGDDSMLDEVNDG